MNKKEENKIERKKYIQNLILYLIDMNILFDIL